MSPFAQKFGQWFVLFGHGLGEDDSGGAGPTPPSNGYVAEDGTTYLVDETGLVYYVQET